MNGSEKHTALVPVQSAALTKPEVKSLITRGHVDLRNNEEAEEWLNKGAESYRQQRYDDAFHCFQSGIQLNPNHPVLQFNLGSLYYDGIGSRNHHLKGLMTNDEEGVEKDNVKAAIWFRKAAEQGYIDSQAQLGLCYSYGIGVLEDHVEAAVWWKKAAEQGHLGAQSVLGSFYDRGDGVPQDYWQAVFWYLKAAEQGDEVAKADLYRLQMWEGEPYIDSLQKWMSLQTYLGYSRGEFKQALSEFEQIQAKVTVEAEREK